MNFCNNCGSEIQDGELFCSKCGAPVQNTVAMPANKYPMKWFKFLIYFALFAGALINVVYGLNYVNGNIYFVQSNGQVNAELIYGAHGSDLKTLDMIYGLLLVAIAAFGIFTRFMLSKYKKIGPMCVYVLYGAGVVVSLLYNVGLTLVTVLEFSQIFTPSTIVSMVVSVLMVALNYTYFNKRKDLFVN